MVLKNSNYYVEISHGLNYCYNSVDNYPYDKIINVVEPDDFTKTLLVYIVNDMGEKEIGLICPYHTYTHNTAILEDNYLWLLLSNVIILLNLDNFEIIKKTEIKSQISLYFGIYRHNTDFIIYGELEIIMLNESLEEKWRFWGQDIFVRNSNDNSDAFIMKEDRICLYDFLDNYYEIDYNGKLLI